MGVEYSIQVGDVTKVASDLLILKYAQNFYGADGAVAEILAQRGICSISDLQPEPGKIVTVPTRGAIAPGMVMFVGVQPLRWFRYKEMRQFARSAVEAAAELKSPVRSITCTVHGAGYGLDIEESLHSMLFGFQVGLNDEVASGIERIKFVEKHPRRALTLQTALQTVTPVNRTKTQTPTSPAVAPAPPPEKKIAFVAMPFSEDFEDVWEFGIYAPIRRCGYTCEKVDVSAFAGDIVGRIQEGIRDATFVVADLTSERPNVYLEVGYAWGLNKPVILLAREGQKLHFDLSHHKCIFYRTIGKLSQDLERLVRELYGPGSTASNAL
jgi:hypothetical protein